MKKIFIWLLVLVVVVGAGYGFVRWAMRAEQNRPGQAYPIQGKDHITADTMHGDYNSNPPTSGPHYAQPANWGAYDRELPDEQLIHNLEHGGIWISYKDIDAIAKSALEDIAKQYPGSVILTPRSKNDSKIAVASWGRLMKLDDFNRDAIIAYIQANKNKSPEPLVR